MTRAAVGVPRWTRVLGARLHSAALGGRVVMVMVPDADHVAHGPVKLMRPWAGVKATGFGGVPHAGHAGQSHPNTPAVTHP